MTPRERIKAVPRHQQPDRVPGMIHFHPTVFGPHPRRSREVEFETLNPVRPDAMDPVRLKRLYGDRLSFLGTVGTPQLWSWGTPAEISAEVREWIATAGEGGGLIIAPVCDLEPAEGIPWGNMLAFFEAVEEFEEY